MKTFNVAVCALSTAIFLVVSPAANARANSTNATNTTNAFLGHTPNKENTVQHLRLFDVSTQPLRGERYLGSTRTATFFYKKGVKSFEKGNLEKAEQHFKAVIRADGSKGLNKNTYHYLANINHKQGDVVAAKKYAEAYYNLN